ncbi:hypothetical protein EP7_005637 (plasmid) [Isosphaeraceae bacterium EP7]
MGHAIADQPCPRVKEANGYILKVGRQDPSRPLTTWLLMELWPPERDQLNAIRNHYTIVGRGVSLKTAIRIAARYLTGSTGDSDDHNHKFEIYRHDRLRAVVSGFDYDWTAEIV